MTTLQVEVNDNLIPEKVRTTLIAVLRDMVESAKEPDFHPGSNNKACFLETYCHLCAK